MLKQWLLQGNDQDIVHELVYLMVYRPDDLEDHTSKILGVCGSMEENHASFHFTFFGNFTDMS